MTQSQETIVRDILEQELRDLYAVTQASHAAIACEVAIHRHYQTGTLDGQKPEFQWRFYNNDRGSVAGLRAEEVFQKAKHAASPASLLSAAEHFEAEAAKLRRQAAEKGEA